MRYLRIDKLYLHCPMFKKKQISLLIISFSAFFMLTSVTGAATEDSVSCTVTVQNVACSVSDKAVAYATLTTSDTANTAVGDLDDSQTITNDGNVNSDFDLKGADTAAWTLAATIGSEQFKHDYCTSDCDGTPTWVALTTTYAQIATGVAGSGTQIFDLQMNTPSSTATFTEQTATVWAQCSAT